MESTAKRAHHLPNGALRKHRAAEGDGVYRECMKNHAASLGGHALDGCGEFMPSPTADPAVPSSLSCAACGCHRNFHRRLPLARPHHRGQDEHEEVDDDDDDEEEEERGHDDGAEQGELRRSPAYSSAPHMLLALSQPVGHERPLGMATVLPKKRFRTKFTAGQKSRMQELSEKLGWRMQKRDEGAVEECCKEIGVSKSVFKVWMHNNKHNFLGTASSRRKEMTSDGGRGGIAGGGFSGVVVGGNCGGGEGGGGNEGNGMEGGNEGSKESSYVVNGCSSSS